MLSDYNITKEYGQEISKQKKVKKFVVFLLTKAT